MAAHRPMARNSNRIGAGLAARVFNESPKDPKRLRGLQVHEHIHEADGPGGAFCEVEDLRFGLETA